MCMLPDYTGIYLNHWCRVQQLICDASSSLKLWRLKIVNKHTHHRSMHYPVAPSVSRLRISGYRLLLAASAVLHLVRVQANIGNGVR